MLEGPNVIIAAVWRRVSRSALQITSFMGVMFARSMLQQQLSPSAAHVRLLAETFYLAAKQTLMSNIERNMSDGV